ncbi:cuticle protein [Holotrichia oblita]|uniref:Cuticle protein n=1 Tax=Holotrichia oblita TaxID=644536 RepID=A0ACB9STJ5_HOLOL|nr:cuticle protein [Holotrichia oblita]
MKSSSRKKLQQNIETRTVSKEGYKETPQGKYRILSHTYAQGPPRLNIPGAVLVSQGKPRPRIQQSYNDQPIRIRRPIPNTIAAPIRETRPVVEELEEEPVQEISSSFDDEVAKLGISSLQSAVNQAVVEDEPEPPRPVQFRPERPVPVLRQDLREAPRPRPAPIAARPAPISVSKPLFRDNLVNVRPAAREEAVPVRRPIQRPAVVQEQFRQAPVRANPAPRPQPQYEEEDDRKAYRNRKPPVQILRKYRTDNEDGSITWGYENDDGTFKEETIGVDCITRGKYGYTDPDGVRREYTYETGGRCEDPDEELPVEPQLVQSQLPQKNLKKVYRLPA